MTDPETTESTSTITVSANASSTKHPRELTNAESETVPTKIEALPTAPTNLSELASTIRLRATPTPTGSEQTTHLPVQPLRQDGPVALNHDSPTPKMQRPASDGTTVLPSPNAAANANENAVLVAEHCLPTSEVPQDASKGSSINVSTGSSNGAITPKTPSTENNTALLRPFVGHYVPTSEVPQNDPKGSSIDAPTGSSNGGMIHKAPITESSVALLSPPIPEIPAEIQKPAASQPAPQFEAALSLPITAIGVESWSTTMPPIIVPLQVDAYSLTNTSVPVTSFPTTEAPNLDPKIKSASSSTEDNKEEDSGKNPPSRTANALVDRKAGNPASAMPETVNAERLKVELTAPANSAQTTVTDALALPAKKPTAADGTVLPSLAALPMKGGNPNDGANPSTGDDQPLPTLMQSAHLTSQIGKSDVKIALQGDQIGMVELHAKVTGDLVSASITVEHHDTHALLSGDLPALHQLLNDRQLRVSEIILLHDSLSAGNSQDDGPPANREDASAQQSSDPSGNVSEASMVTSTSSVRTEATQIFDSRGRLSVRA